MTSSDIDIQTVASELLATAVEATPAWVHRSIDHVVTQQGLCHDTESMERVADAATRAQRLMEDRLGELLRLDIDQQRTTPLSIFRDAARFPVEVLHTMGATPVHRGDVSRWAFPNDPFGITPENLGDVGADVHRAGMIWGAVKAGLHLQRRRDEGLR